MKKSFIILAMSIFILAACHSNSPLPIEKDKYPEIPYFPTLQGNHLTLRLIDTVQTKQFAKYLVSGNDLFIYDSDTIRKFWVIRDNKIFVKYGWKSAMDDQEGYIDTLGNINLGEYKFNSPNYTKKMLLLSADAELNKKPKLSINKRIFTALSFNEMDYVNCKDSCFNSFSSIVVGNESVNVYEEMMPQGSVYTGIYINYFDVNFKGYTTKTKIDFSKQVIPKVIRTVSNLYFIQPSSDKKKLYIYCTIAKGLL